MPGTKQEQQRRRERTGGKLNEAAALSGRLITTTPTHLDEAFNKVALAARTLQGVLAELFAKLSDGELQV